MPLGDGVWEGFDSLQEGPLGHWIQMMDGIALADLLKLRDPVKC